MLTTTPWTDTSDPRHRLLSVVVCPLCGEDLQPAGNTLRCANRHSFDLARQGYVALLAGGRRTPRADTAPMVAARATFLAAGHYAPLARALAATVAAASPARGVVLDAGAGTGYHLSQVLDRLPEALGLGLDASAFALRRAARAHPRLAAASWDVWQPLPVRTASVDVVTNVFAPRNAPEFRRLLRPGGALVVVTPGSRHLIELREPLELMSVDATKRTRLHEALSADFQQREVQRQEYALELTGPEAQSLVEMGPNAHHLNDPAELAERVSRLGPVVRATASFEVTTYQPR